MKKSKQDYISVHMKGKPSLEDFVRMNDLNLTSEKHLGEQDETKGSAYHYNHKSGLLLYKSYNKGFKIFGKTKPMLKYLKTNYPEAHLRLYNFLNYGIDTDFVKLIFKDSPASIEAYEGLSGIKLMTKEERGK